MPTSQRRGRLARTRVRVERGLLVAPLAWPGSIGGTLPLLRAARLKALKASGPLELRSVAAPCHEQLRLQRPRDKR